MKKLIRSVEILVLLLVGIVSIATSKVDDKSTLRIWGVASTCPDATQTNTAITVANGSIISPQGVTFASFGLPIEITSVGQTPISGTINSITRSCIYSTQTQGEDTLHIYTCTASNNQTCLVSFIENP